VSRRRPPIFLAFFGLFLRVVGPTQVFARLACRISGQTFWGWHQACDCLESTLWEEAEDVASCPNQGKLFGFLTWSALQTGVEVTVGKFFWKAQVVVVRVRAQQLSILDVRGQVILQVTVEKLGGWGVVGVQEVGGVGEKMGFRLRPWVAQCSMRGAS